MGHSVAILGVGPRGTCALDFLTRARDVPGVTLHFWNRRAVDIESFAGQHGVALDGGGPPILADVVLLATGHSAHGSPPHAELSAFVDDQRARGNDRVRSLASVYPVQKQVAALGPKERSAVPDVRGAPP